MRSLSGAVFRKTPLGLRVGFVDAVHAKQT